MRQRNFFSKEWIIRYPKTINTNGCWIPRDKIPLKDGYIRIKINNKTYKLHRVVLCVFYGVEYHNLSIETRHLSTCPRACFNPEHIKPGTHADNMKDIKDSNEKKSLRCSIHNILYSRVMLRKPNPYNGQQIVRYCRECRKIRRKKKYHERT